MVKEHQYEYVLVFSVVLQSTFPTATDNNNSNNSNNNNINKNITIVALNNPKKHNAINMKMWNEIGHVFTQLHARQDCRSIILMGMGKSFCSGIDLSDSQNNVLLSSTTGSIPPPTRTMNSTNNHYNDTASLQRNAAILLPKIKRMQECFTALEQCSIPIIAVVHGYCIGAGIDLLCCTDIRTCCTAAAGGTIFAVKEVQMGFAPDVGTLQRLPKVCGANQSMIHELCYTGRNFDATEAIEIGLVSPRYCRLTIPECLRAAIHEIAAPMVALQNPLALQHIKESLLYSRHHPNVPEGLDHIANINAYALQSPAVRRAIQLQQTRKTTTRQAIRTKNSNSDDRYHLSYNITLQEGLPSKL